MKEKVNNKLGGNMQILDWKYYSIENIFSGLKTFLIKKWDDEEKYITKFQDEKFLKYK